MRWLSNPPATELADFLSAQRYPYMWPVELLDECIRVQLVADRPVGYVWGNWIEEAPGVLEVHICIDLEHHRTWATRKLLADLFSIARDEGAEVLLAFAPLPRLQRTLILMGFDIHPPFAIREIEKNKNNHELSPTENSADPDHHPTGCTGSS